MTKAQASTLGAQIHTAQKLAIKVYAKYARRGIAYKQLKAPAQAIKANEQREELARELIRTLNILERKYYELALVQERAAFFRAISDQWEKSRFASFTVYTNGR